MNLQDLQRSAGARFEPGDPVPWHYGDVSQEIDAGLRSAGLVDLSSRGRLELHGSDRLDYLHRITSQAIQDLIPPHGRRAALLEPTGKIVEVFTTHAFPRHLLLLTSATNRERAVDRLRRFIFRSEVQVRDRTSDTGQLLLTGPAAAEVAGALAGESGQTPEIHGWAELPGPGPGLRIHGDGGGWLLIAPAEWMGDLWSRALEVGRPLGLRPVGAEAWSVLRILRGLPEGGAELDGQANPLEAGVEDSVELSKGCFTGQEALAKMVTYGAVKRRLIGLRLSGPGLPEVGETLRAGEERVGRVTSVARLPSGGGVGLALVARSGVVAGARLRADRHPGPVTLANLPFPEAG